MGGECAKQENAEAFTTAYNSGRSATRADIIGECIIGAGSVRAANVGTPSRCTLGRDTNYKEDCAMADSQVVKCNICGKPYRFFAFYAGDQSACPACRAEADRNSGVVITGTGGTTSSDKESR